MATSNHKMLSLAFFVQYVLFAVIYTDYKWPTTLDKTSASILALVHNYESKALR